MTAKKNKTTKSPSASVKALQTKAKGIATIASGVVKANVETTRTVGTVLASGIKEIVSEYVVDSRKVVSNLAANANAMKAVKSLPELLRLQGDQSASTVEMLSATTSKCTGSLKELFSKKVAPLVVDRAKANLALVKNAA